MRDGIGRQFGAHVRTLRRARGLTQDALAERSRLSVDAIRRIERGGFSPTLDTVHKISVGLDVSLGTLFATFQCAYRDEVAELCDFLMTRTAREVHLASRVIRSMLEEKPPLGRPPPGKRH
jgi:transcriptional regulator with XRE-family HTH domain